MAMSGADLGCCGPFKRGVPGSDTAGGCFAECCGFLCPPDCCDELILTFECGRPSDTNCCTNPLNVQRYSSRGPDDVEYEYPAGMNFGAVPAFRKERLRGQLNNLFVLGEGNCPCLQIIVRLYVEAMCCLEVNGNNIFAIGTGYVHAEVSHPYEDCCLDIELTLNGEKPPIFVEDGDRIVAQVKSQSCDCCLVSITDLCAPYGEPLWLPVHDDETCELSFVLNRSEALRRMNLMKIQHIRNSLAKIFRSRGVRKTVSADDVRNIMGKIR